MNPPTPISPLYNGLENPIVRRILRLLDWSIEQDIDKPGDATLTDRQAAIAGGQLVMASSLRKVILEEVRTGRMDMAVEEGND